MYKSANMQKHEAMLSCNITWNPSANQLCLPAC